MEKGLNDKNLAATGLTSLGQFIFVQKWIELFNYRTLDSYQYKLFNSLGLIGEMLKVVPSIRRGVAVYANIYALIEECAQRIETDPCLKKHNRALQRQMLAVLKSPKQVKDSDARQARDIEADERKKSTALVRLEYHLRHCRSLFESKYLAWIVGDLRDAIDRNELPEICQYTELLASELVYRGWTRASLYRLKAFFLDSSVPDFDDRWKSFIKAAMQKGQAFHFYFPYTSSNDGLLGRCGLDRISGDKIVGLRPAMSSHVSPEANYIHIEVSAPAHDLHAAAFQARQQIWDKEAIMGYYLDLLALDNPVVVALPTGKCTTFTVQAAWKDYSRPREVDEQFVTEFLERVATALDRVDEQSQRRLTNLFRQYQLGRDSKSLDTWFTSLWVAVESFVHTGHHASIVEHVKRIVAAVHTKGYAFRILRNFLADCERCGVRPIHAGNELSTVQPTADDVVGLIEMLHTPAELVALQGSCSCSALLTARLSVIARDFASNSSLERLITGHYNNLSWHLQRLYRVRNELMHSAETSQDLLPLSIHLNGYLRSMLSEILHILQSEGFSSLGEVFSRYEDNYDALVQILKDANPVDPELVVRGVLFG